MPIRANRHYHDPYIAQAAANLAGLFAPPSGGDAAGWATANARRAEMNRMGWLFDNPDDPTASRRAALTGVQGYGQTPEGYRYGVDTQAATSRYGHDRTFDASRLNNADNNVRALEERRMQEAAAMERQLASPVILNPGQRAFLPPAVAETVDLSEILEGAPKPLSETEWKATQNQRLLDAGTLTDDDLMNAIAGDKTPVQAVGPNGKPVFMAPGAAVREGAQPYEAQSAERVDNYLAVGPNGEEIRFPGIVGPDGRIVDANTGQVVPNVIRKEGTGGGMSFEVDGQGGVRFTTGGGNTISQQTNLQGQRDAATQSAQELQTLFDNISAADVGVAGNLNDFLTNYGAQIWPDVARGDVTAMRTQLQAATMRLARSLSGDSRISESDRQTAREINAGVGFGESLPGAKAKLAALTVLHAYRAKFAGSLAAGGDPLPPINRSVVGQLVDDGAISPALAQTYVETMLSSSRGGPTQFPGAAPAPAQQSTPGPSAAPPDVDPADWEYMTPEQRALFR